MGKNKLIVVHHQAECGMPRAARAGKQPATAMAELQDEDRTETEKDTTANDEDTFVNQQQNMWMLSSPQRMSRIRQQSCSLRFPSHFLPFSYFSCQSAQTILSQRASRVCPLLQTEGLIPCAERWVQRDIFLNPPTTFPSIPLSTKQNEREKKISEQLANEFLSVQHVCTVPLAAAQQAIDWGGENGFVYGNGFWDSWW